VVPSWGVWTLRHEDDLDLDLRTLTFRFIRAYEGPFRSPESLERYREGGTGTVQGKADANKLREIEFWENASDGISDIAARTSTDKFHAEFAELEKRLAKGPFLMGPDLTVLDVAWFIYANRVNLAGFPLDRLHPRVYEWFNGLAERKAFARETALPEKAAQAIDAHQQELHRTGKSLSDVAEGGPTHC
jgi:hypothetical protein